jgi:phage FluMu protein Com
MISAYGILLKSNVVLYKNMKENKTLLNGRFLKCPRCKQESSVEEYLRLGEAEEYKAETVPIYKCPKCKWIFSLAVPADLYEKLIELLSSKESIPQQEAERK